MESWPGAVLARQRSTAPGQLSMILRGDLDWIVMRCIEKDRTRRYDTANGIVADIQRYLRHEPVVARPPSTTYLLKKLVRRHRLGVAAGVSILGALLIGSGTSAFRATAPKRSRSLRLTAQEAREGGCCAGAKPSCEEKRRRSCCSSDGGLRDKYEFRPTSAGG
jgi:hypothetical protein